jgi:cytochrome b subunit of formate dehydrogenase
MASSADVPFNSLLILFVYRHFLTRILFARGKIEKKIKGKKEKRKKVDFKEKKHKSISRKEKCVENKIHQKS